ncbi:MAG: FkbM family methyltransferase [Chitinophagaceae bacterium]|nr:FkbM family methyltransferase [Chitinophagaceae bacterium]
MSRDFMQALKGEISSSQQNNFGVDNFDEYRFGKYRDDVKSRPSSFQKIRGFLSSKSGASSSRNEDVQDIRKAIPGVEKFIRLYDAFPEKDKSLLITLLAYQHLGYRKVRLPRNTKAYWELFESAMTLENQSDTYDPHFQNFILSKFNLNPIGPDVKLYYAVIGIVATFLLEQYAYKVDGKNFIEVKQNDIVFDLGACWGDTALYFANKATDGGKVYSFEFIPRNVELFNINLDFNPQLKPIIEIVDRPVSDNSNTIVYYQDRGPASKISLTPFDGQTGSTTTISIDDYVIDNNIDKVDFIKMDIEGAEMSALRGAIKTIKKFRPKLAIAIYHSMDDMADIPNWILDLDLGYDIFLDHFTIHAEETVCFAQVR